MGTLAYSPVNITLRAYELALNDLLEQLDGIESEGDEAVRAHRREVVKEVERALEELDERVRAASPVRGSPTPEPVEEEIAVGEQAQGAGVAVGQQEKVEPDAQTAQCLPTESLVEEPVRAVATTDSSAVPILQSAVAITAEDLSVSERTVVDEVVAGHPLCTTTTPVRKPHHHVRRALPILQTSILLNLHAGTVGANNINLRSPNFLHFACQAPPLRAPVITD